MVGTGQSHSILFEQLRSFTTLARTLNLSHAVKELDSTRQTVRRHITQLEESRGMALFEVADRQYRLTEAGEQALPEALDLLARGAAWASGHAGHTNGLFTVEYRDTTGMEYHLQQHPISRIWSGGSELLRVALQSWAEAGGEIEHPQMAAVRPYLLVYRRHGDSWLCCEIGEESAFSSWFGWVKARSSIGAMVESLPGGTMIASLMEAPLAEIWRSHGLRLDHVFTYLERAQPEPKIPMSFQRLTMGGQFPDGSFALITVVERTHDIDIPHLDPAIIGTMPDDAVMRVQFPPRQLQSFVA